MKIKNSIKKFGFSLMEVTLAVLIVAILAMITIPIINRQLEKSDEYSYYLAYRTVEKMSGQIVALGDPEEETYVLKPNKTPFKDYLIAKVKNNVDKIKQLAISYKEKFANSEMFVFSRLFPKTIAANHVENIIVTSWTSSSLDDLWLGYYVCNGHENKIKKGDYKIQVEKTETDANGNTVTKTEEQTQDVYYDKSDFNCCVGYTIGASSASPVSCRAKNANGTYVQYVPEGNETCCNSYSDSCKDNCYKGATWKDAEGKSHNTYLNIVVKSGNENDALISELFTDPTTCKPTNSSYGAKKIANLLKQAYYNKTNEGNVININASEICENYFIKSCNNIVAKSGEAGSKFYSSDGSAGGTDFKDASDAEDDGGEDDPTPYSKTMGACTVYKAVDMSNDEYTAETFNAVRPTFSANWCTDNGYKNMTNELATTGVSCVPKANHVLSANNEKVACPKCAVGETAYYSTSDGCICSKYDFNPVTQKACGEHEVYSGGDKCECISGWKRTSESAQYCTERGECPKGTTRASDGTCVSNPPIVSSKRFCELVAENWNISGGKCDNFTNGVNEDVYNAALGSDTNHTYLSIESQAGAFKNLQPNLVLANGLRMWILGDKAASIPGLSYFPSTATTQVAKRQNMCEKVSLTSHTELACHTTAGQYTFGGKTYEKGYFCSADKNCFKLDNDSYASSTRTTQLLDARGCCSAADYTDFHAAAQEAGGAANIYLQDPTVYSIGGFTIFIDINGTKGEGTLWEDVFPFYISSNGTVYPAYPLNAEKSKTKADGSDASNALYIGGNSDKQLPVDVYYYEPVSSDSSVRERKIAFANVSYARAMCSARKISRYTPYCMNLGKKYKGKGIWKSSTSSVYTYPDLPEDYIAKSRTNNINTDSHNPCDYFVCYVSVKNKLRFF